jgi:hypothetical protein
MGCGQLRSLFVPLRDSDPTKGSIHASLFHQFQFRILYITSYRCPFLYAFDGDKAHSIHHLFSQPDSQAHNKNASHSSKSSFCDFIIALTLYRLSIRDRGCRNGSIEEFVLEQAPEEYREQSKGIESLTVYSK